MGEDASDDDEQQDGPAGDVPEQPATGAGRYLFMVCARGAFGVTGAVEQEPVGGQRDGAEEGRGDGQVDVER